MLVYIATRYYKIKYINDKLQRFESTAGRHKCHDKGKMMNGRDSAKWRMDGGMEDMYDCTTAPLTIEPCENIYWVKNTVYVRSDHPSALWVHVVGRVQSENEY